MTLRKRGYLSEVKVLEKHNGRWHGVFHGSGASWEYSSDYLGVPRGNWQIILGMQRDNRRLYVDNATHRLKGFRSALIDIVKQYPQMIDGVLNFDSGQKTIKELIDAPNGVKYDWSKVEFFHGTSTLFWPNIVRHGLLPRSVTNVKPTHGAVYHARPGKVNAVYLTAGTTPALLAARDAARLHGGEPLVLSIKGINPKYMEPDEDSGLDTAEESLQAHGLVAYVGKIPSSKIRVYRTFKDGKWRAR